MDFAAGMFVIGIVGVVVAFLGLVVQIINLTQKK